MLDLVRNPQGCLFSQFQLYPGAQGPPVSEAVYPVPEGQPIPATDAEYKQIHSFMVDGGDRFGVSSLCFDTQELLWMGNQGVCSLVWAFA